MLNDFQKEKPVTIRCCLNRGTPEELKERLEAEGVTVAPHPYLPYAFQISGYDHLSDLAAFQEGLFTVQDISSMLVAEIASPKAGAQVIDVCAAPGGKASMWRKNCSWQIKKGCMKTWTGMRMGTPAEG